MQASFDDQNSHNFELICVNETTKLQVLMLSSGTFARVAFYPSLLWGILTESSTKRWYDRVDTHLILGALPFKSQTKEVSTLVVSIRLFEYFHPWRPRG